MFAVPVSAFYAGLLGVFYLYLSFLISLHRRKHKISLGDGEDRHFTQMLRAHANFGEFVPIMLVLMVVLELNKVNHLLLHGCGVALLSARLLHAYGVRHHYGASWQRVSGAALTYLTLGILSVANLWIFY